MASAAELRGRARAVLLRLALTSTVPARALGTVGRTGADSRAPTGEARPDVEVLAAQVERAGNDTDALARVLARAQAELEHALRRPLAEVRGQTAEDLRALVVDRGKGFTPQEVSVALRVTPTFVRRARLLAGLDPEHGKPVRLNGNGAAVGVELVAAGLSLRAASAITGTPRSTLHGWVRQATSSGSAQRSG